MAQKRLRGSWRVLRSLAGLGRLGFRDLLGVRPKWSIRPCAATQLRLSATG